VPKSEITHVYRENNKGVKEKVRYQPLTGGGYQGGSAMRGMHPQAPGNYQQQQRFAGEGPPGPMGASPAGMGMGHRGPMGMGGPQMGGMPMGMGGPGMHGGPGMGGPGMGGPGMGGPGRGGPGMGGPGMGGPGISEDEMLMMQATRGVNAIQMRPGQNQKGYE